MIGKGGGGGGGAVQVGVLLAVRGGEGVVEHPCWP